MKWLLSFSMAKCDDLHKLNTVVPLHKLPALQKDYVWMWQFYMALTWPAVHCIIRSTFGICAPIYPHLFATSWPILHMAVECPGKLFETAINGPIFDQKKKSVFLGFKIAEAKWKKLWGKSFFFSYSAEVCPCTNPLSHTGQEFKAKVIDTHRTYHYK